MGFNIYHVDAFTEEAFAGNPAAVCPLTGPADEAWMQHVAHEMSLPETAFLYPEGDGFHLRWFTPKVEVDLCGHATLASAHLLWEMGMADPEKPIRFHSRSGTLTAVFEKQWIWLDFPAEPAHTVAAPYELERALGIKPKYVAKNRLDFLAEMPSEAAIHALRPDMGRLAQLPARGVIVTAGTTADGYDFVSRFFSPATGIPEDPVTGSGHCCLGPFWGARLKKDEMTGYQASERGGVVKVRLMGDRVSLGGRAVTVMHGRLTDAAAQVQRGEGLMPPPPPSP
jgi:PhzF family phenazine biosynthesis protein